MDYRLKLYINSVSDMYSDIMAVDLDTYRCFYYYVDYGAVDEIEIPYAWEEAKRLLAKHVHTGDRARVLAALDSRLLPGAEVDSSFSVTYRAVSSEKSLKGGEWKLYVAILESGGQKLAIFFSRDYHMDMKRIFGIKEQLWRDKPTFLYNRAKLNEMLAAEYGDMACCGALYINVNDFLSFRDTHGSREEEAVLTDITGSIKKLENALVQGYRYSRDGFLVIAKDYGKEEFASLVHRWVGGFRKLALRQSLQYNVAVGHAWDCTPVSVQELIARAKAHMFGNKKMMKSGIAGELCLQDEMISAYGLLSSSHFFKTVDYRLKSERKAWLLIAIDIEHFKLYNKWWGRQAGDMFLKDIALVLREFQDEYDGLASYIGGDNYAVLLPDNREALAALADRLSETAREKTDNVAFVPAMGVYHIAEDDQADAMVMLDRAQEAQSRVLGNYDKRCCFYEESMTREVEQELNIVIEAREAVSRHHFYLVFQPKCHIATGRIVGGEALVRWRHPQKGLIMPGAFIPVLERTGFVTNLDMYVWEEVCRKLHHWLTAGIEPVPISVNVSRIDILSVDVVEVLERLLKEYSVDKKYIKVEITESAYVDNADKVLDTLKRLQAAGFTLMMDDFGSGYSSLNMLRNMAVDILKIDMKFLDIGHDDMQKGHQILQAVINMSKEMSLPIIVEGVETREQADFLEKLQVRYAQGYLFYRPIEVEQFEGLLMDETKVDHRGIIHEEIPGEMEAEGYSRMPDCFFEEGEG